MTLHRRASSGRALTGVIVILLILAAVGALLPPFFTGGRCTKEFDARTQSLQDLRAELATADKARTYLTAHGLPFAEISSDECKRSPPPGVEYCGDGPVLLTRLQIADPVCRFYRDDAVKVQLLFNGKMQLTHLQTDMKPFKILSAPVLGLEFYWAR